MSDEFLFLDRNEHVCIDWPALLARYKRELLDSVVPFWLRYAIDTEHGGLFTCISDAGEVLSTDKY
ncbi:MAG TPA: hypothetical protein ENO23_09440, partial [Alphaproteobacteria bacterium]|nr:hypothetical protein [Alphaproteobacteria bacterium]